MDNKIKKLDIELGKYRDQLKGMRDGRAKDAIKQKAVRILQQKKTYMGLRDQVMQQSFNMEQANFVTENLKTTKSTVEAMSLANKQMKKEYRNINIDKIDSIQDEMADLMDQASEVQEAMSRSYNVDFIDDDELDAELSALGDEIALDEGEQEPSYLDSVSAPNVPPRKIPSPNRPAASGSGGGPKVPNDPLDDINYTLPG